jgi:ribonuclease HII
MKRKNFSKMVKNASGSAELRKVRGKTRVSAEAYKTYDEDGTRSFNKEISQECRFCVGIDEAGRGPLAGPVAIGIAVVPRNFDWALIPGVNDSKKLTEKKREIIFLQAQET